MTKKKYILFLSTNNSWGGSEVLWTHAISTFKMNGYSVKAGAGYPYETVKQFVTDDKDYIHLANREVTIPLFQRILVKMGFGKSRPKDILQEELIRNRPDLIIISQGNNTEGRRLMNDCARNSIPFVTITQLVMEECWPGLDDGIIDELRTLYRRSLRNYFVSAATMRLHQKILGEPAPNARIIYNPFTKNEPGNLPYPLPDKGVYKIALIGRIETYHKGYDLLIEVLTLPKWKERPVHFSIFGKGPHTGLLQRTIVYHQLQNITLHHHIENIEEVWQTHHILLMPSRMEGQSLTLIEAMHYARAAIVTNAGGAAELVEENVNGFIAPYPTVSDIDAALERAWQHRDQWEAMGIQARKSIAAKQPGDAITDFYEQVNALIK